MSSRVTLKAKVDIAKTLSAIVAKSFGPECGQTLLCTSTGKVVVTSDGMTIIGAVHMSHPVARLIVDCVRKHHRHVGDGVKTFLLYLCHALSSLDRIHDKSGMGGSGHANGIAMQLNRIERQILPQIWEDLQSSSVSISQGSVEHLKDMINTVLSSHLTKQNRRHLSDVIFDTIIGNVGQLSELGFDDVYRRVMFMVTNFNFLHFKIAKQLMDTSSAVQGFIVRRDFTLKLANIENRDTVKFVLMLSSIEGKSCEEPDEIISVKSRSQFSQTLTYRKLCAEKFLERLHQKGVALIITSEKVPAYVLSVCREVSMSVISLVDVEDIQFLEMVTGLQAITSPLDAVSECCLGELAHCQRKTVGPHRFVHMTFTEQTCASRPWTLVIAAPTEGMVDQLASVVFKAYKCIQMCFSSRNLSHISTFDKSSKNDDGIRVVGAKLQSTTEDSPSSRNSYECFAIAGGGYFEFKTASVLKEVSNDFTDSHIGDGCRVLHDCLLAVPRSLHRQLSGDSTTEAREYLQKLQAINTVVSGSQAIGLDRRGRVCDPVGKGVLEPLAAKVHVLSAVVQLLQQLVRIDTIVSVRSLEVPSLDTED